MVRIVLALSLALMLIPARVVAVSPGFRNPACGYWRSYDDTGIIPYYGYCYHDATNGNGNA